MQLAKYTEAKRVRESGEKMKKIFLMGRSEAGKTSLTQALKGEELHYIKTQYTNTEDDTIDSPGEYAESKHFSVGLACFSFEADVIAMVQAADEPFNLFGPGGRSFIQRPLIGIITKVDSPYANIPMVRQWMENAGCERIFEVNNVRFDFNKSNLCWYVTKVGKQEHFSDFRVNL